MRNPIAQRRAINLRGRLTDVEAKLWRHLRKRQISGHKFRRQVPIGPFIADFVCTNLQLVIEVDGGQHQNSHHDERRDVYLRSQGFRVLRFWDNDVLQRTDSVLEAIWQEINRPHPNLPP